MTGIGPLFEVVVLSFDYKMFCSNTPDMLRPGSTAILPLRLNQSHLASIEALGYKGS
jgi:hypothetical protein